MQKIWAHKWLVLSLIVAIFAGRMLLTSHHFYVHDDIQVFRLAEFVKCFETGQIPCRWSPDLGKGYGYPWFNFYPPMIYVVASLFHFVGFSLITSLNLMAFSTFILSAWGMFLLVKELTKNDSLAFFGSMILTLYPFHATNIYLRGVYAENLAWSLTPWILFYLYRQINTAKVQKILPFLFASLFLTHIISTFIVLGIVLLWTFIHSTATKQIRKGLTVLFTQLLIGLAMSSFFIIPALVEKGMVQSDSLTQGYYSYLNHFVSLKQLFLDYTWNYGASYWGQPAEEMGYMVGHVHTILVTIIFSYLIFLRRKKLDSTIILTVFLTLAFLILAHPKSDIIYRLIPQLSFVQFPWRFIGWAGIPLALSIALGINFVPKKISKWIILAGSLAIFIYSFPFFRPRAYDSYQDEDFITGSFRQEQQTKALFDYLPLTVVEVPEDYASHPKNASNTFYFPGWTGFYGDKKISISAKYPAGTIVADDPSISPEKIELVWSETPFRLALDLVSILSLAIYGLYLLKSHVQ